MKSRLNLYDKDRNIFDLEALGLFGNRLIIPSPSYFHQTAYVDSGQTVVIDKQLNPRELTAEFYTKESNYREVLNQKALLFELFGNGQEFFVEQIDRPNILWRVKLGAWTPSHFGTRTTMFSIPLTCYPGVAETINVIERTFTETTFNFKNHGSVVIDPRKHSETELIFRGESTNLSITNKTTGTTWSHNGTTTADDEIKLVGVRAFKNGISIFKDTNKKVLTLTEKNSGANEVEISGATGEFELTICTRFYFL